MRQTILSINAGSSSVKMTVYKIQNPPTKLATAQVAGLTAAPRIFKYSHGKEEAQKREIEESVDSPQKAFDYLLDNFVNDPQLRDVASKDDFVYVCHRVVHGGKYEKETVITHDTYDYLEALTDLAPLHNTGAMNIIQKCLKEMPDATNVAYFDTTFHQSMPECVKTYPINQDVAKSNWLRKYGFHGISYSFILRSVANYIKKPAESTNIIALHLGSGASACAIRNGKSVDTSMGLTPLAGLPGATRSGNIDPSLVFHYTSEAGKLSPASTKHMHISTAEEILNKQSGWKSLTGTTDFAEIGTEKPASKNHKLAFDIFVDRISGFIGSYFVKLNGQVDAIVFAGGIGEKSALLRKAVVEQCKCLGFVVDEKANSNGPDENAAITEISKRNGKAPRVLICQTDEDFEMAYHSVIVRP